MEVFQSKVTGLQRVILLNKYNSTTEVLLSITLIKNTYQ